MIIIRTKKKRISIGFDFFKIDSFYKYCLKNSELIETKVAALFWDDNLEHRSARKYYKGVIQSEEAEHIRHLCDLLENTKQLKSVLDWCQYEFNLFWEKGLPVILSLYEAFSGKEGSVIKKRKFSDTKLEFFVYTHKDRVFNLYSGEPQKLEELVGKDPESIGEILELESIDGLLVLDDAGQRWFLAYSNSLGIIGQRTARRQADTIARYGFNMPAGYTIKGNYPLDELLDPNIGDLWKTVQQKFGISDLKGLSIDEETGLPAQLAERKATYTLTSKTQERQKEFNTPRKTIVKQRNTLELEKSLEEVLDRISKDVTLDRLSELLDETKLISENILKKILRKQPTIGIYHELEQVFSKNIDRKQSSKKSIMDSLQICPICNDQQSILVRQCTKCKTLLDFCKLCKRGFSNEDNKTTCPYCDSYFHYSHILEYLKTKGQCPVCKKSLSDDKITN